MATKKMKKYALSMKEALSSFDLKKLLEWLNKYNHGLYSTFKNSTEEVQMATMCKMICNRTDMLNSEAHKKALSWLKEHNMKGRLF